MSATHTRTHVSLDYLKPNMLCSTCHGLVEGFHDPEECGCDKWDCQDDMGYVNVPCGHPVGVYEGGDKSE